MKYIVTIIKDNNPPFNYRVEAGSGAHAMSRAREFWACDKTYTGLYLEFHPYTNQDYVLDIDEHLRDNPPVISQKMRNFINRLK